MLREVERTAGLDKGQRSKINLFLQSYGMIMSSFGIRNTGNRLFMAFVLSSVREARGCVN